MSNKVFIVGSPRSGTTLTGKILNAHPDITTWFVPYFMWERHFRDRGDDVLTEKDCTREVKRYVKGSFDYIEEKTGCRLIVDQSPRNSFRIGLIKEIFPEAKYVNVIREPGDSILSINKEWKKRIAFYNRGSSNISSRLRRIASSFYLLLELQPVFRYKMAAVLFEVHGFSMFNPASHYNRRRWGGRVGWGPRFRGWKSKIDNEPLMAFNAHQWVETVREVSKGLQEIDSDHVFELRYEHLLRCPEETIEKLMNFVNCSPGVGFWDEVPVIRQENSGKWKKELSEEQVAMIARIIS